MIKEKWVTVKEFAELVGVTQQTVIKAIKRGRVQSVKQNNGRQMMEWNTQSVMWRANCTGRNKTGKNMYTKEKHIGTTDVQDTNDFKVEDSDSTYDHIPESDLQDAPPKNSVAYQQFRKLAVDVERNKLKLGIEAGELIKVEDAQKLYCEKLVEIADNIQNIPARVVGLIGAIVRINAKDVSENIDSQIFNVLNTQCKSVLADIIRKKDETESITKEFIADGKKNHN